MLDNSGEITPPCGAPSVLSLYWPFSSTPAFSQPFISFSTLQSIILCPQFFCYFVQQFFLTVLFHVFYTDFIDSTCSFVFLLTSMRPLRYSFGISCHTTHRIFSFVQLWLQGIVYFEGFVLFLVCTILGAMSTSDCLFAGLQLRFR